MPARAGGRRDEHTSRTGLHPSQAFRFRRCYAARLRAAIATTVSNRPPSCLKLKFPPIRSAPNVVATTLPNGVPRRLGSRIRANARVRETAVLQRFPRRQSPPARLVSRIESDNSGTGRPCQNRDSNQAPRWRRRIRPRTAWPERRNVKDRLAFPGQRREYAAGFPSGDP